jgi:large subunit ribosomal protein L24
MNKTIKKPKPKKVRPQRVQHVKRGENVIVIAGNDKGRTGEIKNIDHARLRVLVDGVNLRWKHRRATQQGEQGERVQEECSIHASNVLPIDPASGKGTRKRSKVEA